MLVVALFAGLFAGTEWSDGSLSPKLALDLEGGTQIILQPVTENDEQVSDQDIAQAIDIIRQRVDASGVAEAEITSQGSGQSRNIVVAIPGEPSEDTLNLVRQSAQMFFRPVIIAASPVVAEPETAQADLPAPVDASDPAWLSQAGLDEFAAKDCTAEENLAGTGADSGNPDAPLVTCEVDGSAKYVLGPVEVTGRQITGASSNLRTTQTGAVTNEWVVNFSLDS
ncbi:MAG TPA: protein translocase subunit SecD, partial [Actinotalea sp.]|nr:protein translocase subunit SecD [Actinotalea sp.]